MALLQTAKGPVEVILTGPHKGPSALPVLYASRVRNGRLDGRIDFKDMVLRAAQYAEDSRYVSPFRHILVDEFRGWCQNNANDSQEWPKPSS